jgi:hypothetical protein
MTKPSPPPWEGYLSLKKKNTILIYISKSTTNEASNEILQRNDYTQQIRYLKSYLEFKFTYNQCTQYFITKLKIYFEKIS